MTKNMDRQDEQDIFSVDQGRSTRTIIEIPLCDILRPLRLTLLLASIRVDSRFLNQFFSSPRNGSGQRPSAMTAKASEHSVIPVAQPIFEGAIAAPLSAGTTRKAFSTRR